MGLLSAGKGVASQVSKQAKRLLALKRAKKIDPEMNNIKLETMTGSNTNHFRDGRKMSPQQQQEFHAAGQKMVQTPQGEFAPAVARGQSIWDPPGRQPQGPGYWENSQKQVEINPSTEYRTRVDPSDPNDISASQRDAAYSNFVLAQDGSAPVNITPGFVPKKTGGDTPETAALMFPEGTSADEIRGGMTAAGYVFDDDYFISPGADGPMVGFFDWSKSNTGTGHRQAVKDMEHLGAKPYYNPHGENAYQGGHNTTTSLMNEEVEGDMFFRSRAREATSLMDTYDEAKKADELGGLLRGTAKQAPAAFKGMGQASGGTPHPEFVELWRRLRADEKTPPQIIIRKMIEDGDLTKLDGDRAMQLLMGQQPQGLLA